MDVPNRRPALELRDATRLLARVTWRDRHLGEPALSGELALSVGTGEAWQGRLSISACDAAEEVMVGRRPLGQVSDDQVREAARAAVAFDAGFFGLEVSWDTARWAVLPGLTVRVAADVRSGELLEADVRTATVRLELVDLEVTRAEWTLLAGGTDVLDAEVLRPEEHSSPSLDSMVWFCLFSLREGLEWRGLPPAAYWQMAYSVMPAQDGDGSCGELRVWSTYRATS